jgi:flagellar basal body-associated protein FliL
MKSPKSASKAPTSSSIDLADDEIDDDEDIDSESGFSRPSKTLIAAIFILTLTLGIAGYAGFTLWSLSDHSTTAEQSTAEQPDGSVTLP